MDCNSVADNSLLQSQMFKVAMLSSQTRSEAESATDITRQVLDHIAAKLDLWYKALPDSLHLKCLTSTSETMTISSIRPLLLMHMLYFDARIMIYSRAIRISYKQRTDFSGSAEREAFGLPEDVHQTYTTFAWQLARMVDLCREDKYHFTRCWIAM